MFSMYKNGDMDQTTSSKGYWVKAEDHEAMLGRLKQAFHINMLRAYPNKTHAELTLEIERVLDGRS
jgi:hypothetical protein